MDSFRHWVSKYGCLMRIGHSPLLPSFILSLLIFEWWFTWLSTGCCSRMEKMVMKCHEPLQILVLNSRSKCCQCASWIFLLGGLVAESTNQSRAVCFKHSKFGFQFSSVLTYIYIHTLYISNSIIIYIIYIYLKHLKSVLWWVEARTPQLGIVHSDPWDPSTTPCQPPHRQGSSTWLQRLSCDDRFEIDGDDVASAVDDDFCDVIITYEYLWYNKMRDIGYLFNVYFYVTYEYLFITHMLHGAGIFTNICPKNHQVL